MSERALHLPFAAPDLDESEWRELRETLESGWITTGPKTKQFEAAFAQAVGAKRGVAVNSCTAAMHLALEAVGLQPGDEVITSPYTFAASAEVIRYFDARPVFVDIDAATFNIDPAKIERAITARAKAIIPIHMAGLASDLDSVYEIAAQRGLAVIEDAAHAFPSEYKGRRIGQSSRRDVRAAICFSFYATKTLTTGEGGMICTDDEELADRCQIMALHGISRDAWKRYTAEGSWRYDIIAPGYKYNMTDVAAAMGLAQLRKAERMWQRRCEIAQAYNEAFAKLPQLEIPQQQVDRRHSWHLYMLRLNLDRLSIDRAGVADELKARKIGISVHFIPLHIHPYYRETYGYQPCDYPVAYQEYMREVSLPIYSKMSDSDTRDVIEAVSEIVARYQV